MIGLMQILNDSYLCARHYNINIVIMYVCVLRLSLYQFFKNAYVTKKINSFFSSSEDSIVTITIIINIVFD